MVKRTFQVTQSRPTSSAYGCAKQDVTVKTSVTDQFKDELTRFWKAQGYASESDFVREALIGTVHGPKYLTDLHRQRIEALVRNSDRTGQGAHP